MYAFTRGQFRSVCDRSRLEHVLLWAVVAPRSIKQAEEAASSVLSAGEEGAVEVAASREQREVDGSGGAFLCRARRSVSCHVRPDPPRTAGIDQDILLATGGNLTGMYLQSGNNFCYIACNAQQ